MTYTAKQIDLIGHSLGINVYHAKKKGNTKLPKEFYRNRFCAGSLHSDRKELDALEKLGYMESWYGSHDTFFSVTDKGIAKFRAEYKDYINSLENPES